MGFAYGHQYTAEEVDFIENNYQNFDIYDLSAIFNKMFPPGVSIKSLTSKIRALGITKRKLEKNFGKYTQEMLDWLCEVYKSKNILILKH